MQKRIRNHRQAGECQRGCLRGAKGSRYYQASGGGITLSGGEPMCQPEFARALLRALKDRGIHTAVETNGAVDFAVYESILSYTDLFLVDYKLTDKKAHKTYTGVAVDKILENFAKLAP